MLTIQRDKSAYVDPVPGKVTESNSTIQYVSQSKPEPMLHQPVLHQPVLHPAHSQQPSSMIQPTLGIAHTNSNRVLPSTSHISHSNSLQSNLPSSVSNISNSALKSHYDRLLKEEAKITDEKHWLIMREQLNEVGRQIGCYDELKFVIQCLNPRDNSTSSKPIAFHRSPEFVASILQYLTMKQILQHLNQYSSMLTDQHRQHLSAIAGLGHADAKDIPKSHKIKHKTKSDKKKIITIDAVPSIESLQLLVASNFRT